MSPTASEGAFVALLGGQAYRRRPRHAPVGRSACLMPSRARSRPTRAPTSLDIGLVSTDALYFAVGKYGFGGGVMITASHNPAQYNGMKLTRSARRPSRWIRGSPQIRDQHRRRQPAAEGDHRRKHLASRDILDDFAEHCLSFIDRRTIKPFKIAIDAGNGMAGETIPYVFKKLPCEVFPLFFRARRQFSESPRQPDRTREHGRLASRGSRARHRYRRRLRRRCRPDVYR